MMAIAFTGFSAETTRQEKRVAPSMKRGGKALSVLSSCTAKIVEAQGNSGFSVVLRRKWHKRPMAALCMAENGSLNDSGWCFRCLAAT